MTYTLKQLKEMIPIYLNDNLSEAERAAFDDGLKRFPELESELVEFSDIKESYAVVTEDISLDSDALFARIQQNIEKEAVRSPEQAFPWKAWLQQAGQWLTHWYRTPALSWSLAGAQFAILLMVLLVIPKEPQFTTYTAPPVSSDGIRLNIVFHQSAQEIEIRTLLQQLEATIVDGPRGNGLYVLEVSPDADVNLVIQKLKDSGIVRLAEKVVSSLEPTRPFKGVPPKHWTRFRQGTPPARPWWESATTRIAGGLDFPARWEKTKVRQCFKVAVETGCKVFGLEQQLNVRTA